MTPTGRREWTEDGAILFPMDQAPVSKLSPFNG